VRPKPYPEHVASTRSGSLLQVRLFGGLTLTWGDATLLPIVGRSARSLFAYLITYRHRAHTRDLLAGTFWPDSPGAQARRHLSQALWQIRRVLSPLPSPFPSILTDADTTQFNVKAPYWLDTEEFQVAGSRFQVDSTDLEPGTWNLELETLRHAVQLYSGDFMDGFYDDWALLERERLRELYLHALERLITLHKQRGDYEQALTYAQRLAAADPLREAAHQDLLRLYHLLGRTRAALEQFATLQKLLAQELGISPSPTTVALCQEIAAALEEAATPHLPVAPPPPPLLRDLAHLPFVGRTNERATLLDGLQAAIQGHGGLALVEGDAGVGKTRLVSTVISDAEWRGFQVGLGKADPLATLAPYQLLRDALLPLLTPLRIAQLAELVEPLWLSAVAPLFSTIATHLPDLPTLPPLDHHEEQQRLWEGLARCLAGLASISPLLLVLG